MLITGKKDAPFRFQWHLRLQNGRWCITDELFAQSWSRCSLLVLAVTRLQFMSSWAALPKGTITALAWPTQSVRLLAPGRSLTLKRYFWVILLTPIFDETIHFYGVSLIILSVIYSKIDFPKLIQVFQNCDGWWMVISLGMVVPLTMLTAWRLQQLMPLTTGSSALVCWGKSPHPCSECAEYGAAIEDGDIAKAYFMKERHLSGSCLSRWWCLKSLWYVIAAAMVCVYFILARIGFFGSWLPVWYLTRSGAALVLAP